jgi:hypothetical protein
VFRATWQRCRLGLLKKGAGMIRFLDVVVAGEGSSRGPEGAQAAGAVRRGSLRDLLPEEYVLVRVDRVLNLGWLHEEVAELYDAKLVGRAWIARSPFGSCSPASCSASFTSGG